MPNFNLIENFNLNFNLKTVLNTCWARFLKAKKNIFFTFINVEKYYNKQYSLTFRDWDFFVLVCYGKTFINNGAYES